jgi:hypothetical protein
MPIVESLRLGDMAKGEPVPESIYHVRILKADLKTAQPSDKNPDPYPYLSVALVITGDSPEEHHGRQVFTFCTLEPGKNFTLRQLATAVFGEDEDLDIMEVISEGRFVEAELLAAIGIQKAGKGADGKHYEARNQVKKFLPLQA